MLQRFLVSTGDAGAGQNIVELVHQQRALEVTISGIAGRDMGFHCIADGEGFQVVQGDFREAVVTLDIVLVGQSAPMQLQIQLAAVGVGVLGVGFQLLHKAADRGVVCLGAAFQVVAAPGDFHHFKLGSAAAVTKAVGDELAVRHILLAHSVRALGAVYILIEILGGRPHVGLVQMGKNPGAVDALPIEGVIGELVGVVPGHFRGEEVLHVAALHNLGNSGGITEGVRQPEGVGGIAEILAGEPLAPQELADHGLAGGNVAVAFHPDAAVGLIAALLDLFLNPGEELGIVFPNDLAVISGALDKGVFRILLHEVQLVGIGAGALLNGLIDMPQPGSVHVRMADDAHRGGGGAVMPGQSRSHNLLALVQSRIEFLAADAGGIIIEHLVQGQHHVDELSLAVAGLVQDFHQLVEGAQVKVEVSDFVVLHADVHGGEGEPEIVVGILLKRHGAHDIVARIEFQVNFDLLASLGVLHQHIAVVVAVAGDHDLGGIGAEGLAVHPQQGFVAAHLGPEEQGTSRIFFGNLIGGFEPAIDVFAAPDIPGLDGMV